MTTRRFVLLGSLATVLTAALGLSRRGGSNPLPPAGLAHWKPPAEQYQVRRMWLDATQSGDVPSSTLLTMWHDVDFEALQPGDVARRASYPEEHFEVLHAWDQDVTGTPCIQVCMLGDTDSQAVLVAQLTGPRQHAAVGG